MIFLNFYSLPILTCGLICFFFSALCVYIAIKRSGKDSKGLLIAYYTVAAIPILIFISRIICSGLLITAQQQKWISLLPFFMVVLLMVELTVLALKTPNVNNGKVNKRQVIAGLCLAWPGILFFLYVIFFC